MSPFMKASGGKESTVKVSFCGYSLPLTLAVPG